MPVTKSDAKPETKSVKQPSGKSSPPPLPVADAAPATRALPGAGSDRSSVEKLLDVAFFAPIGLHVWAQTPNKPLAEFAELARLGEQRYRSRAAVAKLVGEMVVAQQRSRVRGARRRAAEREPLAVRAAPIAPSTDRAGDPAAVPPPRPKQGRAASVGSDTVGSPELEALPIEGYDSIPARSLIPLLAGLEASQRDAVLAYERAHRNRSTVVGLLTRP